MGAWIREKPSGGGQSTATKQQGGQHNGRSVAYTVCKMLGLQTDDYSFGYVAGWSKGKDAKELTASMETIRKTANKIYEGVRAA